MRLGKLPIVLSRCQGCGAWVAFRVRCAPCEGVEQERLEQLAAVMDRAATLRERTREERDRLESVQIGVWFGHFTDVPGQEHQCNMLQPGNWLLELRQIVERRAPGEVAEA